MNESYLSLYSARERLGINHKKIESLLFTLNKTAPKRDEAATEPNEVAPEQLHKERMRTNRIFSAVTPDKE